MAAFQSKRSLDRKSTSKAHTHPLRKVVHFPQAKGKVVEGVEFSTYSDYHNIAFKFEDKTCLNFTIDMGFTLGSDYSDWKTGNQRVIRKWPVVRSAE
jgi:hypothetical protein